MRKFLIITVFILLLTPLFLPFFAHGILKTYDGPEYLFRIAAFRQALLDGDFLPGWTSHLAYGWGSPVFLYNWTLPLWMAQPFLAMHISVIDSLKIVEGISLLLSFVTMALLLSKWYPLVPTLLGAFLYCWAPHRIYLTFTAGSLGEEVSLALWPLIFLSVIWVSEKKFRSAFTLGALSIASLMLSHQIMFLMIMPLWICFVLLYARNSGKPRLILSCLAFLLTGLLLTSYFWLPAILQKQYIHIDDKTGSIYQAAYLPFTFLLLEPGFFQLSGDNWFVHIYGVGWILLAAPILWIGTYLLRKKPRAKLSQLHLSLNLLFIPFFCLALFLITKPSKIIWQITPLLSSFQYPFRFETLALFCGSLLFAGALALIRPTWFLTAAILIVILFLTYPAIPTNNPRIDWPDTHFYYGDSTSDMTGEFLPKWTPTDHFFGDNRWQRYDVARITEGFGNVSHMVKQSSSVSFQVNALRPAAVTINQLFFPGWQVLVNGRKTNIIASSDGEMAITVPAGSSKVSAHYVGTVLAICARVLSLISWVTFVLVLWFWARKKSS